MGRRRSCPTKASTRAETEIRRRDSGERVTSSVSRFALAVRYLRRSSWRRPSANRPANRQRRRCWTREAKRPFARRLRMRRNDEQGELLPSSGSRFASAVSWPPEVPEESEAVTAGSGEPEREFTSNLRASRSRIPARWRSARAGLSARRAGLKRASGGTSRRHDALLFRSPARSARRFPD